MNNLRSLLIFLIGLFCTNVIAQEPAKPIFKDGQAQPVEAFSNPEDWITQEVWVESEFDSDDDGKLDRMYVFVQRPKQTETEGLKLPVIYISSPYFAGVAPNDKDMFWNVYHELGDETTPRTHTPVKTIPEKKVVSRYPYGRLFIPYGYNVVYSSSPGTGLSQGAPTIGGENEALGPKAVIDWLNGRAKGYSSPYGDETITADWSTGKVGMIGTSYNGTLALAAATTGVDGLEAIIPVAPNTSSYHYYRSHGLVRSPGGYLGEDIDVLYDFINSGDTTKRSRNNQVIRDEILMKNMDRKTGDYNDFWAGRDYLLQMDDMKAAMLVAHGFNDWNVMPEHSHRIYTRAKELGIPTQIYYHQRGHGGMPPKQMINRWFTRYLHGVKNDVEKDTLAWIRRENTNKLTAYVDYPNPEAKQVTFYLHKHNVERGSLRTDSAINQGNQSFVDDYQFTSEQLAQATESTHRLLFTSPLLKKTIHISGLPEVTITLSSSKPAANLSVYLVSLPWNTNENAKITDNIITRSWADPQNHKSETESAPLKPGEFYTLRFTLQPDDQVIPAGQQIGLMIFSSDPEFTLLPKAGTELTIDLDQTKLTIPIVGGQQAYEKAISDMLKTN